MDINNFDDYEEFVEWRPVIINNKITIYEVSNIGQVRNKKRGRLLKPWVSRDGYLQVRICLTNKINIPKLLHRIVAFTFIPNDDPEHKTQVNHIDGNKRNNRVENLEWCTPSENVQHAFDTGLKSVAHGSDCSYSKYNDDQINLVCQLLERYVPMQLIAELTKVNYDQVKLIKNGRNWKHISSQYNIDYKEKYNRKIKNSKYGEFRKNLVDLGIFENINLSELLYFKHITHKRKLIEDLEKDGYEIFIDKELENEFIKDYGDRNND